MPKYHVQGGGWYFRDGIPFCWDSSMILQVPSTDHYLLIFLKKSYGGVLHSALIFFIKIKQQKIVQERITYKTSGRKEGKEENQKL